jgi:hypothetical protein
VPRKKASVPEHYASRIIGYGTLDPITIKQHPNNWRTHPLGQQRALHAALHDIGWVQSVIVNKRTGHLIDGHLRLSLSLAQNESEIPVQWVDLSEEEENLVLATLDPISALAGSNTQKLHTLLQQTPDYVRPDLHAFITNLARQHGLWSAEPKQPERNPTTEDLLRIWKPKFGQRWCIASKSQPGEYHHFIIGNSNSESVVQKLCKNVTFQWLWTDIPQAEDYVEPVLAWTNTYLEPGASCFVGIRPTSALMPMLALFAKHWHFHQELLWVWEDATVSMTNYQMQHRSIFYGWKRGAEHTFTGKKSHSAMQMVARDLRYPDAVPQPVIAKHLLYSTEFGAKGFDPFLEYGTTILAAESTGRLAYGVVCNPISAASILQRCTVSGLLVEKV